MNRYTITNEQTGETFDFTNKKNAARKVREMQNASVHFNAYLFRDGVRMDNGTADALAAIMPN